MEFRTELKIEPSEKKIHHKVRILSMGSCFADVIGTSLKNHKFSAMVNPFGTIFNPISISKLLKLSLDQQPLPDHSYLCPVDRWQNYHVHSSIFGSTKEDLNYQINNILTTLHFELLHVDYLIITLGTSLVYRLKESGDTVANCHKMPGSNFTKILLSPEEITLSLKESLAAIKKTNPKVEVILTVSPVRHIKDTLPMNSASKAILRYACHTLSVELPFCQYFPAYEILNDDLRDYRFYKEDMIHPTKQAEDYIWEKFSQSYFSDETRKVNSELNMLIKALNHKPYNPDSITYKNFVTSTLNQAIRLSELLPLESEINELKTRLND